MSLEIITPPATTPISRAELKTHLRVDTTAEDDYIDTVILAATDYFEQRSWRQLITATYGMYLDAFPTDFIEFPKAPLQSITSVVYQDTNGATQGRLMVRVFQAWIMFIMPLQLHLRQVMEMLVLMYLI